MSGGICLTNTPWSIEALCPSSKGNCDIDGKCICLKGFTNDLTFYRFRNCLVPEAHDNAMYILCFITSILAFSNSLRHLKESRSLAKFILKAVFILETFRVAFVIAAISYGYGANTLSFLSCYFLVSATSFCARMTIYSLLIPLYKTSQQSREQMEFIGKATFITFRVIGIAPVIASIWYNDESNHLNDYYWNLCVSTYFTIVGIEIAVVLPEMVYFGVKMIKTIQSIGSVDAEVNVRKLKRDEYANRVKNFINYFILLSISISLLFLLLGIVFFALKYMPYAFAVFDMIFYAGFMYSVVQVQFVVSKKIQTSNTTEKSAQKVEVLSAKVTDIASKQVGDSETRL